MRIAILVSGRGSNMLNLVRVLNDWNSSLASVELVLSNRSDAPALIKAEEFGVKSVFVNPEKFKGRENFDREVVTILKDNKIDLICLAGFMRILSPYFVKSFPNRILNIHPSLFLMQAPHLLRAHAP
jgi:phosphoribosylglycinamide formyltransferase-1